jgi:hypothetical protein
VPVLPIEQQPPDVDPPLSTIVLVLVTHALEGLLLYIVIEVAIGLLHLRLLLLDLIVVVDDLGGLEGVMRVEVVEVSEEVAVDEALMGIVDHLYGLPSTSGQHVFGVHVAVVIKDPVNGLLERTVVPNAGQEQIEPFLEVLMPSILIQHIDQLIGELQFEGVVGVVS